MKYLLMELTKAAVILAVAIQLHAKPILAK